MNKPPFEFGQTIYIVTANAFARKRVPCPICFGKLFVVLILGNGEHVQVECEGCGLGFDGPRGWINENAAHSTVDEVQVTGMTEGDGYWEVVAGHQRALTTDPTIFTNRALAEKAREVLHKKAETHAMEANFYHFKQKSKSHAWKVRQSRSEIKDAERRIAWHSARLRELNQPKEATP